MSYAPEHWERLALEKLTRVMGEVPGRLLYTRALADLGLTTLTSADDLHRLGQWLTRQPGFTAAVGGLLSVQAVIQGAQRGSH